MDIITINKFEMNDAVLADFHHSFKGMRFNEITADHIVIKN